MIAFGLGYFVMAGVSAAIARDWKNRRWPRAIAGTILVMALIRLGSFVLTTLPKSS